MQDVKVNLRCDGTRGAFVDAFNNPVSTVPNFAIFTDTQIKLKLFHNGEPDSAFAQGELSGYSFEFWADADWDSATSPKIGTITGISVDADGVVTIPVDTGNEALIEWLGSSSEKGLKAELLGFDGDSREYADFCVQFSLNVTNRVFYSGSYTPSPVEGLYYTKTQADLKFYTIASGNNLESRVAVLEEVDGTLDGILN